MSRENILTKVKKATDSLKDKASYPEYDVEQLLSHPRLEGANSWEIFAKNFKAVNGKPMTSVQEIIDLLQSTSQLVGYCDPALFESIGKKIADAGITVETTYDRSNYDRCPKPSPRLVRRRISSGPLVLLRPPT